MKAKDPASDRERAEGSRETVDEALPHSEGHQQGISNRPLSEERRQQEKLAPRDQGKDQEDLMTVNETAPKSQSSAGKTGMRSDARKHASANRGGIAPGKARAKAGAYGMADRRPANTARAKRGTTRAAPAMNHDEWTKLRARAPRLRSRWRAA